MPTTVNLLWFGNLAQINTNPATPASDAQARSLIGHSAEGRSQLKPVEIAGETVGIRIDNQPVNAFATTYNPAGTSDMSYLSPQTGQQAVSQITGFFRIQYDLRLPDDSTVTQSGVLMQMANGDIFMRPALSTVSAWDGISVLRGVTIVDAAPLPVNTYAATISFGADIFDLPIVCFAAGTMILTSQGERPVQDLRPGDLVWTRDHGYQPIRWHGRRDLGAADLAANPKMRPIRITAGALGPNLPARDLTVSPQHRILVRSQIAQRMFGAFELLVPARQLTDAPGIDEILDATAVSYIHLLFDRHEVIRSDGAETESLYPGPQTLKALRHAAEEIFALFPELRDLSATFPGARPFATGAKARQMVQRHGANGRALFC